MQQDAKNSVMLPRPPVFAMSAVSCRGAHLRERSCRYRVAWCINPHMRIGAVDFERAAGQHLALRTALCRAGAQVIDLPFVHGAYDSVFIKDSAILIERNGSAQALLCAPRFSERRCEQLARAARLYRLGVCVQAPPSEPLEGGDVVMLPGGRALLGHGLRSARS